MIKLVAAPRGEPVDALAEVDRLISEHDGELWRQLDHGLGVKKGLAVGVELSRVSRGQMQCQARAISALKEQARVRGSRECVARYKVGWCKL